ncbi:MAG TPA: NAD(P)H-dependent oxidoreductase [Pyrinomonadaceae bacterium]|nr:NAD(P)H-dependent oxidoreductase [Pyrinomonadaceae bacterium]
MIRRSSNLKKIFMTSLKIITSTTREKSQGIKVARWITEFAKADTDLDVELLDLRAIGLPLMDEPEHPRLGKYTHDHTKEWSKKIAAADAFIIVLGEYNYGYPAPIKNAIDYLFNEWTYKPVAFVSYGGISAGLRSTQMLKQVVTTLNMMPIAEQVNIPLFAKLINEDGQFVPDDAIERSALAMLKELKRWSDAMKPMRQQNA